MPSHKVRFDPASVGVLITSTPYHQRYWEQTFPCWNDSPFFVLMGYDDYNLDKVKDVLSKYKGINEIFCTGQRTGLKAGELIQLQTGFDMLHNKKFPYVLKVASDHRITNLAGVSTLWRMLEGIEKEGDPLPIVQPRPKAGHMVGHETAFMFGFTVLFNLMMKFYKKTAIDAEEYFRYFRRLLNLKAVPFGNYDLQQLDIIGLRHLHFDFALELSKELGRFPIRQEIYERGEIYK